MKKKKNVLELKTETKLPLFLVEKSYLLSRKLYFYFISVYYVNQCLLIIQQLIKKIFLSVVTSATEVTFSNNQFNQICHYSKPSFFYWNKNVYYDPHEISYYLIVFLKDDSKEITRFPANGVKPPPTLIPKSYF